MPATFAVYPNLFGKIEVIEWREGDFMFEARGRAQLHASALQHRIAYWVMHYERPEGKPRKAIEVADTVDIPYNRFQQLLTGKVVMQLEDVGRLRSRLGEIVDLWMLDGVNLDVARSVIRARSRK